MHGRRAPRAIGDGAQAAARVHDGRVHFDGGAVQAQDRTAAGVETAIVFHRDDGGNGGFQRIGTDVQFFHGALGGVAATVVIFARASRAAVYDDGIVLRPAHLVVFSLQILGWAMHRNGA